VLEPIELFSCTPPPSREFCAPDHSLANANICVVLFAPQSVVRAAAARRLSARERQCALRQPRAPCTEHERKSGDERCYAAVAHLFTAS